MSLNYVFLKCEYQPRTGTYVLCWLTFSVSRDYEEPIEDQLANSPITAAWVRLVADVKQAEATQLTASSVQLAAGCISQIQNDRPFVKAMSSYEWPGLTVN